MASSNHGGGSESEPPQLTSHHSDKCSEKCSASPASPPLPSGSTYPPPHTTYYTAAGHPPVPGGNHNPHAYPPGYAAYAATEYYGPPLAYHPPDTGYPTERPPITPYYGPPPTYRPPDTRARLLRSFIFCCCVILMSILLVSLVITLTIQPMLPKYKVVSMTVANFTAAPLSGEWDTKMTAENPNKKITTLFSSFKVDLMYEDGVIAMNSAPSFSLDKKESREIEVKSWSNHANEETLQKNTKDDMAKERSSGSITFTLKVYSVNLFKSGSFSTKSEDMVTICEGLKVVFQSNNATNGALDIEGKPIECRLYV